MKEAGFLTEEIKDISDFENENGSESVGLEGDDNFEAQEIIDENQEMLQKLDELQKDLKEQEERFLRLAAEYDNYRKRSEKDRISAYNDGKAKTVAEILSIADCIERAIEASGDADAEYQKGLRMLSEQFDASLGRLGVESFGCVGDGFDPELHNAISHIESDEVGENVIAQIFQKGYKMGDKIIRHAMVSVAN